MASMHKLVDGVWYKWQLPKPFESDYLYSYALAVGKHALPQELKTRLWHEENWEIDNG
jgi:hypothetical protein